MVILHVPYENLSNVSGRAYLSAELHLKNGNNQPKKCTRNTAKTQRASILHSASATITERQMH